MKKKRKILVVLVVLLGIATVGAIAILFHFNKEVIEQIKHEVTLSYKEAANRNSSYYFTGQRDQIVFDNALFKFDQIKDYNVKLTFREKVYTVIFHIKDDVKPEVKFLAKDIDLNKGFDLGKMYTIYDKSKVSVSVNLKTKDIKVGKQKFCVSAKDAYGNTNEVCETLNVVDSTPTLDLNKAVSFKYDFANMSLNDIIEDYKKQKGITTQLAVGYYNFVTKESYFNNGDAYMVAGSTYKLPLNMYLYELQNSGALSPTKLLEYKDYSFEAGGPVGDDFKPGDKLPIADLQYYSIMYSDNTASRILFDGIGGWGAFREAIKKYSPTNSYDAPYYGNSVTVKYMVDVCKYLYNNYASFPELTQRLFQVTPGDCLKKYVYVPIMQKDGVYMSARNSAGVVYADKPYATAIYTSVGEYGDTMIGEVNLLLYSYAQAH